MMKLLTVIGARPQFVKAATVSRVVTSRRDISEVIVHTGQHYHAEMSTVFFDEMQIPKPNHHLGIGGGSHGQMTGRQLEAVEQVMIDEKPDWVLVYGDTNSSVAGALAAVKLHIPLAHVEAGLRTFNRRMPEEVNRVIIDHIADINFAPTNAAAANLAKEGIPEERIQCPGDVMYDAALHYREFARKPEWFNTLGLPEGEFVLATVHRAENTDNQDRLASIFQGLAQSELPVVLPLHPRTRIRLKAAGIVPAPNIHVVNPVGYFEMIWLEAASRVIASDSGGVQKEAYFHGRRCIVLSEETGWVELIDAGWNVIAGTESERIASALANPQPPSTTKSLYGDGDAAELIVSALVQARVSKFPMEILGNPKLKND